MRIAVATTSYPRSEGDPSGHFVRTEARQLVKEGHEVIVFCPGPAQLTTRGSADEPRVVALGCHDLFAWPGVLPRLRQRPWRVHRAALYLWRLRSSLVANGPYDRLVAHWLVPTALIGCSANPASLEAVAHGSDVRLLKALPRPLGRLLLTRLFRADCTVRCVSTELRRELVSICGPIAQQAIVAPAALELGCVPTRSRARAELDIGPHTRLVVVVGRLIPSKRCGLALRAASLLPDTTVAVIGDGPEIAQLQTLFPAVTFHGNQPRPETLRWLRAADLLLSASRLEGAPTVIREARALGTPVVTSPGGDVALWAESDPELQVTR